MKHAPSLVLTALSLLAAAPVLAQPRVEVRDSRTTGDYAGVTPESQQTPPRHGAAQRSTTGTLITWPGFQMRPNGGSRFFLQVTRAPETAVQQTPGRFEVLVRGTKTHLRNTRRPLETRFFNTPVTRARVERRGRDLAFVFELRADVTPTVSQQAGANGYHFIVVDFPAGTYVEGPPPPPAPAQRGPNYPVDDDQRLAPEEDHSQDTDDFGDRPLPPPGMRDEERPPGM